MSSYNVPGPGYRFPLSLTGPIFQLRESGSEWLNKLPNILQLENCAGI